MKTIVVFASGSGTNAEKIISYFAEVENVLVSKIYTNNPNAGVINRASNLGVKTRVFDRISFKKEVLEELQVQKPALIVLAGFLWKIPQAYTEAFPNKIINIHPALLPKYGGKGMYGAHVFDAIVANSESETGITIHYVNEHYDEGTIIFQAKTRIATSDTASEIAQKTHILEYAHFAPQIHQLLQNG
ncbi:MAG: phosphoribosylglycinamide formyltransferase [Flavobacteriales bacterium]|nr:MAG: phosphoribosylglycinamide formyltransferase [Flavobacteriales bacterium]